MTHKPPYVKHDADALVNQLLTVMPYLPKKLFGDTPLVEAADLHPTHFHILHMLEYDGALKMRDIAGKLSIKKSNLTPLVRKLLDKGLVKRLQDEADKRIVYIQLTDSGKHFLSDQKMHLESVLAHRLSPLGNDDRKALSEAMDRLCRILDKLPD
ncbi:MarR family winged helix-turn-helix transcriptional regulator [Salisediminibacterium beveridgei]|uniref:Transcriptional regulator, MarR family n=1 Tax=Salisediminibacterium beveridgei TaxID=632773 RepID=A0A1D7QR29_9BACI|nr:MarR family transcriptional regulator [Salisediminibacterium beveridgei]AOM81446.1 Transcriptional regulator, MarR family [Salisediminibacterium beveridgei]